MKHIHLKALVLAAALAASSVGVSFAATSNHANQAPGANTIITMPTTSYRPCDEPDTCRDLG
ncbi:hypothetical protein J0676_04870 [Vibrio sp. Vb2880]|uniref:hypothetical protein n=1 Tax=Vibrio TaxID=662 RepID=UPI0002FEF517|nr:MULTISPECIES: hypothetical protein [Vibrio]MBO0212809.1 hypothetical protein [Vibrio sp. Vb2880]MCG6216679.1 hypothetical protein [Vibrio furnissii]MCG6226999.1 hypothetical protein [Vibrio furnissii]MCG6233869.1 hypothetical protein [Vibrio furnissii]MCG6259961.1 hypothetical protein [Vibrio furnissii]